MRFLAAASVVVGLGMIGCGDDDTASAPEDSAMGGDDASMVADAGESDGAVNEDGGEPDDGGAPPSVCPELEAIEHTVDPGNGPDSLGDADSDANGIIDRDEWGALAFIALDTDNDGVPDYEDVDDDGDGLLDLYDPERLDVLGPVDIFADGAFRLDRALTAISDEERAFDAGQVGRNLTLTGQGLSCDVVVVFAGGESAVNVAPVDVVADGLVVPVPAGAQGPIFVVAGGERSNEVQATIVAADEPLLFALESPTAPIGEELTIVGLGLAEVAEVEIGGTSVIPTDVSDTSITISVPTEVPGPFDELAAITGDGERSNSIFARAVRMLDATVELPAGVNADDVSLIHHLGEQTALGSGTTPVLVGARSIDLVVATVPDAADAESQTPVLQAYVLPSDDTLVLSTQSSAVSAVLLVLQASVLLDAESLVTFRDSVSALSETSTLAAAIGASGLATTAPYDAELRAAVEAAQTALDDGLSNATLVPPEGLARFGIGDARIVPDDVMAAFDVYVVQRPDTNNINIQNDTQLFLSAEMTDIESRKVVMSHIASYFDARTIGPQSGILWGFSSNDVELAQPEGRDVLLEVVTPGTLGDQPTEPRARHAQDMLRLRVFLERIIAPLLTYALGRKFRTNVLATLLIKHALGVVNDFRAAWAAGDASGAFGVVLNFLKREVEEVGPFLTGLVDYVLGSSRTIRLVLVRIGAKLIPGLGQVAAILEAISALATAINLVKTVEDIVNTPGKLDFEVTFGLAVTGVGPSPFERRCFGQPLFVDGAGLYPRFVDGEVRRPEVLVRDAHPLGAGEIRFVTDVEFPTTRGTELQVSLPETFSSTVLGPIEVEVTHLGETVSAPMAVPVTGDSEIVSFDPPFAAAGSEVTINGAGLSDPAAVYFVTADDTDPPMMYEVTSFVNQTDSAITLTVPALPMETTEYHLFATIGPAGCQVNTNVLLFRTEEPRPCYQELRPGLQGIATSINNSGVIMGSKAEVECFRVTPLGGTWFQDTNGDDLNDLDESVMVASGSCYPHDMTESGSFAGSTAFPMEGLRGFIWSGGAVTSVGVGPEATLPGASDVLALNESGVAVGETTFGDDQIWKRAFVFNGSLTILERLPGSDPFNQSESIANDINDAGDIVGASKYGIGASRAVIWPGGGGAPMQLPDDGGTSYAEAINNNGTIAGNLYTMDGEVSGVIWRDGMRIDLGNRGGQFVNFEAINELDQAVGTAYTSSRQARGMIWLPEPAYGMPAGYHDLTNMLGGATPRLEYINDINDNGQIVGSTIIPRNGSRAWVVDLNNCLP